MPYRDCNTLSSKCYTPSSKCNSSRPYCNSPEVISKRAYHDPRYIMRFVSSYEVLAAVFASLDVNDADVAMLLVMNDYNK